MLRSHHRYHLRAFVKLSLVVKSIINSIEISVNTTLIVGLKLQHVSTLGGHHQVELKNLLFTSVFCRIIFHLHTGSLMHNTAKKVM